MIDDWDHDLRFKLEYKNQGYELPEKKYLELNANWIKRLMEATRDFRWSKLYVIYFICRCGSTPIISLFPH